MDKSKKQKTIPKHVERLLRRPALTIDEIIYCGQVLAKANGEDASDETWAERKAQLLQARAEGLL